MDKAFSLNEQSKVYLYGAASIGKIIKNQLDKMNIHVEAFIDKRAFEMDSFLDRPVISLDEFFSVNSESVVIVSVKNVFEHYQIISGFINKGFFNLIYMPKEVLDGTDDIELNKIGDAYNALLDGTPFSFTSLRQTKGQVIYDFAEYPYIHEEMDSVIVNIPISYLYTNNYRVEEQKWGNVNLLAFFTHLSFFEFQLGLPNCNINDYLEEYCVYAAKMQGDIEITDAWKENVIRNRTMIFQMMNRTFDLDYKFFLRSPITAKWNPERKIFNLTSGKHRAMFLTAKGKRFIPVKISRADYASFLNISDANSLKECIVDSNYTGELNVDNPLYYLYPIQSRDRDYVIEKQLSSFFARELYRRYDIVDFSKMKLVVLDKSYNGVGRHFLRMGANVEFYEFDELDRRICQVEQVSVKDNCHTDFCAYLGNYVSDNARDYICLINVSDCDAGLECTRFSFVDDNGINTAILYQKN